MNDERRRLAEQGICVVANVRKHHPDAELVAWAKATGRYVYIGRPDRLGRPGPTGCWGNRFKVGRDGTREECIAKFTAEQMPEFLPRLPILQGGKVLGCGCHPEPCHGHVIAEAVNRLVIDDTPPV